MLCDPKPKSSISLFLMSAAVLKDKISDIPVTDIQQIAERFRKGVETKDRRYLFRKYTNCFVGREAVDWLLKNEAKFVSNRADAVALGLRLMDGKETFAIKNLVFKEKLFFFAQRVSSGTISAIINSRINICSTFSM